MIYTSTTNDNPNIYDRRGVLEIVCLGLAILFLLIMLFISIFVLFDELEGPRIHKTSTILSPK